MFQRPHKKGELSVTKPESRPHDSDIIQLKTHYKDDENITMRKTIGGNDGEQLAAAQRLFPYSEIKGGAGKETEQSHQLQSQNLVTVARLLQGKCPCR